jgi:hypothetical protein
LDDIYYLKRVSSRLLRKGPDPGSPDRTRVIPKFADSDRPHSEPSKHCRLGTFSCHSLAYFNKVLKLGSSELHPTMKNGVELHEGPQEVLDFVRMCDLIVVRGVQDDLMGIVITPVHTRHAAQLSLLELQNLIPVGSANVVA